MNQRSTSMIRKMKTDLGDEHAFEKKIAKAMKDKKEYISRMTTPRASQQAKNYSSNNPKPQKSIDEGQPHKQTQNTIRINRQFVENIQEQGGFGLFTCINHPKKRGLFEGIHEREHFYCHECAISLVKSNIQVVQISSESLIVKMFLEEQLDKIAEQEAKAKTVLEEYYLSVRDYLLNLYKSCHESIYKTETIEFGSFEISDSINKMIANLGQIEPCHLKFDGYNEKQNNTLNGPQKEPMDKFIYRKDRSIDPKTQSNRSLQANPQKNASFIGRTRDNSFYKKNSKVDIPKAAKYDAKKSFYLR